MTSLMCIIAEILLERGVTQFLEPLLTSVCYLILFYTLSINVYTSALHDLPFCPTGVNMVYLRKSAVTS